ncbi:hypothetical protein DFH28DRAFT_1084215 [Melampsora americana]|nr:hypothetical protein DFH28DRAFT_1084215 [Melampsora americana]
MVQHTKAKIKVQCNELLHLAPGTIITTAHICKSKQVKKVIAASQEAGAIPDATSTSLPFPRPSSLPKKPAAALASTRLPFPKPTATSNYSARFDGEDINFVLDYIERESNQRELVGAESKTSVGALSCGAQWNILPTLLNSAHNNQLQANNYEIFGEKASMSQGAIRDKMDLDASLDDKDNVHESSEQENKNIMPSATEFDDFEGYKPQQHPNNLQDFLHADSPDFSHEINMLTDIQPAMKASKAVADQPSKHLPPIPVANAMIESQSATMQFYNENQEKKETKEEPREEKQIVWH